ncbi:MAG: DUF1634 domain-containing protein [Lentisphaerae bacterium]|nr:DUF1634 domain-containing protein [Lentisphaerota bacterium]
MTDETIASPPDEAARMRAAEQWLSRVLTAGVRLSLALIVCGGLLALARHGHGLFDREEFHRLSGQSMTYPHTPSELASGVWHLDGQAIVALGLAVLILTPVARVAVSVLIFIRQRDRTYTLLTLAVLVVLVVSFFLGHAE